MLIAGSFSSVCVYVGSSISKKSNMQEMISQGEKTPLTYKTINPPTLHE